MKQSLRWARGLRLSITIRGWATIAVALTVIAFSQPLGTPELGLLGVFLLALFGFGVVYLVTLARLSRVRVSELSVMDSLHIGQRATAVVRLRQASRWPVRLVCSFDEGASVLHRELTVPDSTSFVQVDFQVTGEERGLMRVGVLAGVMGDPFGLARLRMHLSTVQMVAVLPDLVNLDQQPVEGASASYGAEKQSLSDGGFLGSDVREYHPGDPVRHIHWRQSARQDKLVVRSLQDEQQHLARIIVVVSADGYPDVHLTSGVAKSAVFERAVSLAATIGVRLIDDGADVELTVLGREATVLNPATRHELLRFLATMNLELVNGEHTYSDTVVGGSGATGSSVVVIAGNISPELVRVLRNLWGRSLRQSLLLAVPTGAPTGESSLWAELREAGWRVMTMWGVP